MVSVNTESLTMAFVVAISKSKIEGILASAGSIVSKSFWIFLGEMAEATKSEDKSVEQTCFIFDNASLHHSKEFLKFSKERRIRCLTIPPYLPQLNPAEKIIAAIKARMRESWQNSNIMSLGMVKKIVDSINSETWAKCFRSRAMETFKTMKLMNNS